MIRDVSFCKSHIGIRYLLVELQASVVKPNADDSLGYRRSGPCKGCAYHGWVKPIQQAIDHNRNYNKKGYRK